MTTGQIAKALFPTLDFAQHRLQRLTALKVVDRFPPFRAAHTLIRPDRHGIWSGVPFDAGACFRADHRSAITILWLQATMSTRVCAWLCFGTWIRFA
jgi:hypothetical protein